jgi:phospholipid N-methyltransferase
MSKDCVLICLEVNNEFVAQLNRVEDSRLHVYNACASSIREILNELNFVEADYVVSSLPLSLIDDDVVKNILVEVDSNLKKGGRILQYQYSLANYGDMKPFFRDIKLKFTFRNMPPAFVYECIK